MIIILRNNESLICGDFKFKCVIGRAGKSFNKIEGDKKTPKGVFTLGNLFYRADRKKRPETDLKCIKIDKSMGWCDDVNNKKKYNKKIIISKSIKHEKMYRKDTIYDLVIPIKYNFFKPKVGKGSAIFLHVTKKYKPTAGCIAINKNDFLILLRLIDKKTKIIIT